ncbi:DUF3108 domain-containing protein [Massilia soli]|uniref:DUF3108 domain-containing protein n=1 Tax=Massilia soli TaxID=2792854 RepID=A0ABS7SHS6_9BURK|nr:DUF3108 domain-containing protein [Massilia soli]MBZ2205766.1 DUF3108 domain-containing protein [Massilia soli]
MTFAFSASDLRLPLLAGATLLLHYAAFGWVEAGMEAPGQATAAAKPAPIVAQLRAPPPAVPTVAAAPPAPMPPPKRKVAAPVKQAPPAPAPAGQVAAAAPEAAPEPVADIPAVAEATPAEQPAAPLPRQYKASVPPSSRLTLDLDRIDAKGTHWQGVAEMAWQVSGDRYTMAVEAGVNMVVTKFNLLSMSSEGSIGDSGFAPRLATEKRRGRSQTATHFNSEQASITFSASQASAPLPAGAQDKTTLPLQLAAIARADPAQFEGGLEITVGEERGASVYSFMVAGQEEIETALGKLQTWRLSRPPKPGSYNSRLEVWLAPALGWYPVRIRNTEANGAVTTQTVTNIVVNDTGNVHAQ